MSHSLDLSDEQRAHLVVAEADTARLNQLLCHQAAGLTGHEWQIAACLASAAAEQVQVVADLAGGGDGGMWAITARLLRESAARFEVWADLADVSADATGGVNSDAAYQAA